MPENLLKPFGRALHIADIYDQMINGVDFQLLLLKLVVHRHSMIVVISEEPGTTQ
jgi:hypothetical protein